MSSDSGEDDVRAPTTAPDTITTFSPSTFFSYFQPFFYFPILLEICIQTFPSSFTDYVFQNVLTPSRTDKPTLIKVISRKK